jgi:hypothetical protein
MVTCMAVVREAEAEAGQVWDADVEALILHLRMSSHLKVRCLADGIYIFLKCGLVCDRFPVI